ncbi:MAG: hypothetical protein RMY29_028545 [Nostoc sp. CreGUA01]|nr:hypothetical protein [Nostoc sp. CreGUA01]
MKRFPCAESVICASHYTPSWRQLSANSSLIAAELCCRSYKEVLRSQI